MDKNRSSALYDACLEPSRRTRRNAYRQLGRFLHDVAWRRVAGDPRLHHLAEESMQEALLTIWRALEEERGPDDRERFLAWAATIVVNKVREGIRRLEPRGAVRRTKRVALSRQRSLDAPPRPGIPSLGETLPDDDAATDSETAIAAAAIRDLVAEIATIEAVSERSRLVLLEGFLGGLDDAALSQKLGTSRSNVHVIRSRDLGKLRAEADFMARLAAFYES
jgi:RNA polymerase sigma factor (sigma-70 family)